MRLDDRPRDREAHSHAALFRGEECIEYLVGVLDAGAGIADLDAHEISVPSRADPQRSRSGARLHGLETVAHEVDEDLLYLHPVERDRRNIAFDARLDRRLDFHGKLREQPARFRDEAVQARTASRLDGLPEQSAYPADDRRGGICVADDPLDGAAHAL